MPTYDYRCAACGHALEIFHGISEKPKRTCPRCKKPKLERLISAGAGIVFKGSGFYQTDYRSDSYKAAEKAASAPTESAKPAETKSDASADATKSAPAKPAEKAPAAASPAQETKRASSSAAKRKSRG